METKEMVEKQKYIDILEEQEKDKAIEIAHLFQRDALSYEDFKDMIEENKRTFAYLKGEFKDFVDNIELIKFENGKK